MEGEIKKIKIRELPEIESVTNATMFVVCDTSNTYRTDSEAILKHLLTDTQVGEYILQSKIGVANGVVPLNENTKIDGHYITYGKADNTSYKGSDGKILEQNFDNHLTDKNPHGLSNWALANTKPTYTYDEVGAISATLLGSRSGVAQLDENGLIPANMLPSFVDDVIEGTYDLFPENGESGKIYVDTITNLTYRWSGSGYVEISKSLALGETSSTAYAGDKGKVAYDHSQSAHARTDATKVEKSTANGNIKINGTETVVYTHPSGTNPHGTTKSDVGLGNVEDKSSSTIRSEITSNNVTTALGYTPISSSILGKPNGVAQLDENGKINISLIPSEITSDLEVFSNTEPTQKENTYWLKNF